MGDIREKFADWQRPCRMKQLHGQRGMAIISMLLVVAVIVVLAAALLGRQTTAIHAAQTEQTRAQAHWLLRGEISRAQLLLRAEAQREPTTRLDGFWNRPVNGQVLGEIAGVPARAFTEIIDEQSKFNLRNLISLGQVDPVESAAFLRLCALVGVPSDQASRIARRVVLSLVEAGRRSPAMTTPSGIKAAQQLGLSSLSTREQAPRLRAIEDLLGVPGIDPDSIARLRPYATVLPQRTWINANTAKAEVLSAWVPGLAIDRARAMLQVRDSGQWFINRGDFVRRLQMPELDESEILIGITSQWFRVSSALQIPRTTLLMQALVHDDKEVMPQVMWLREGA